MFTISADLGGSSTKVMNIPSVFLLKLSGFDSLSEIVCLQRMIETGNKYMNKYTHLWRRGSNILYRDENGERRRLHYEELHSLYC